MIARRELQRGIAGLTVHNLARMEAKSDGYRTRHRRSAMRLVG